MKTISVQHLVNEEDGMIKEGVIESISYDNNTPSESDNLDFEQSRSFSFLSASVSYESEAKTKHLISRREVEKVTAETNIKYWRNNTHLHSVGNFDDDNFKEIVAMGDAAIPFILREMEKGPTPLVRILDILYPDVMTYNGLTTIEEACNLWLPLLRMI